MYTDFFAGYRSIETVKKEYKRLAMQFHPDRGGDTATMQEINRQYQAKLKDLDGVVSKDDQGEDHTYYYNEQREQALIDKISEVLSADIISDSVEFFLIGSWLWVVGETKPVKDRLGKDGMKFSWHSKRTAWYWHCNEGYTRYNEKSDLSGLAEKYGATRLGRSGKEMTVFGR